MPRQRPMFPLRLPEDMTRGAFGRAFPGTSRVGQYALNRKAANETTMANSIETGETP